MIGIWVGTAIGIAACAGLRALFGHPLDATFVDFLIVGIAGVAGLAVDVFGGKRR